MMEKRWWVLGLVALLVLPWAVCGSSEAGEKKVVLKLGTIQPVEDPSTTALNKVAEVAKAKSEGSLEIQIFPASQLGNATSQVEAVGMGSQDMFVDSGWLGTFLKDKQIESMFFVFRDEDHYKKYIASPLNKQLEEDFRKLKNIRIVTSNWFRAPRSFVTKKALARADELVGMKVRVPDLKGYLESIRALGAKPTQIAWAETYLALQQGVVDAAEGPTDSLYTMKFFEAANNVTLTYHNRDSMQVMINDKIFAGLSKKQQDALTEASTEVGAWYSDAIKANVQKAVDAMTAKGAKIAQIDVAPMKDKLAKRIREIEASGSMWRAGLFDQIQNVK